MKSTVWVHTLGMIRAFVQPFGAAAKGSPSSSPQAGSGYGYRHTPPRSTYDTYRLDKKLGPDTDERLVYFQKRVDVLNTEIETALRHVARDLPLMEADIKAWKQLNDQVRSDPCANVGSNLTLSPRVDAFTSLFNVAGTSSGS
jgi:hypothetical protein